MKGKRHLFALLLFFSPWCAVAQYTGGANDGYSSALFCSNDLNGTSATALTIGSVVGNSTVCGLLSDNYSVTLTTGVATSFVWFGPSGSNVIGNQSNFTSSQASIQFAGTNGIITVTASNGCSSVSNTLAVTASTCNTTFGGNNDGYSSAIFCGNSLAGGAAAALALNAISGSTSTCSNGSDNYSVTLSAGTATSFQWAGPSGSSIAGINSTFSSSNSSVSFGSTNGTLSVTASNGCTTATTTAAITLVACNNFLGGTNDGYTSGTFCGSNLSGSATPAITLSAISGSASTCSNYSSAYSITLLTGNASSYAWTLPSSSMLNGAINTVSSSAINLGLGTSNGTLSVSVTNGCTSASASLALTVVSCNNTLGGNDDGYSSGVFCGTGLNGGAVLPIALNPIQGNSSVCSNLVDNYSISLSAGNASRYVWAGPSGYQVTGFLNSFSGSQISMLFGSSNGTVSVTASNECSTSTASLAVTVNTCNITFGGNNDGYSSGIFCGNDLTGTPVASIALGAISGAASTCLNLSNNYSVNVTTGSANVFTWAVPSGASVTGTINSSTSSLVSIGFGPTSGNVTVSATNGCSVASSLLTVSLIACNTTLGGNNDGYSSAIFCGNNLAGASAPAITISAITGNASTCSNLTDTYSIAVLTGASTSYVWSVPSASAINGLINSTTASIASVGFGSTNGTVSVTASNQCTSATANLAITLNACNTALGGSNDGFSIASFCGTNMNGGTSAAITLNSITGNGSTCSNLADNYNVTLATGSASTISWSGPVGSQVAGTQGNFTSSQASITFATTSGNVSVTASNSCSTATTTLAVALSACNTTLGGVNDGFSVASVVNVPLPITLVAFSARVIQKSVVLEWTTASELNNQFFTVERSLDGRTFLVIGKVDGSGTTSTAHHYSLTDPNPFEGISYYRLSQTDFDKKETGLGVVSVNVPSENDFGFQLYPNPAVSQVVTLLFSQDWWNRAAELSVTDVVGNPVMSASFIVAESQQLTLSNGLSQGVYIISIKINNNRLVKKLVVP